MKINPYTMHIQGWKLPLANLPRRVSSLLGVSTDCTFFDAAPKVTRLIAQMAVAVKNKFLTLHMI